MNPTKLLIDHSEKVLVAGIAIGLLWWTIGSVTDPEIQPSVTATQVTNDKGTVERALNVRPKPHFREFEDVRAIVQARYDVAAPPPQIVTGITDHPDITAQAGDILVVLSGYEIGQPTLSLSNRVGSMQLTIVNPDGTKPSGGRVQDVMKASWQREILSKVHENKAEIVGLYIEVAVGEKIDESSWRPLNTKAVRRGILMTSSPTVTVSVNQLEQWAKYHFRARLLVSATSPKPGERPSLGREVYVFDAPIPWGKIGLPPEEQLTNARFEQMIEQSKAGIDINLAKPAPVGMSVPANEVGFQGVPSAPVEARALSDTTVALMRVLDRVPNNAPVGAEAVPHARIGVNKRLVGREGMEWTGAQEEVYVVGQKVGGLVEIKDPNTGDLFLADLNTPWKVVEIKRDVERTLYYEVKLGSVLVGENFEKQFQVIPKTRKISVVVLENEVSGSRVELTELLKRILVRAKRDTWYTPAFKPGEEFGEQDAFRENPVDFRDPPLAPAQPLLHQDQRLLRRLIDNPLQLKRIAMPYVEMPEGFLLYYDKLNKKVEQIELPVQMRNIRGNDMLVENKEEVVPEQPADEAPAEK